ncbi:MAG: urease accessory protein UreD [Burkholderiaceae bacterium]
MAEPSAAAEGWQARLEIAYRRDGGHTLSHDRHVGPLRVLQRLYPEGPAVCHHVLVHPPGGIVGGDRLDLRLQLAEGSHALLTTPGATRFYRSAGPGATQHVHATLAEGARLEWLPLETIAYRGCQAESQVSFELAPGAQMLGWDLLALGLPAAGEPFDDGRFRQHLAWPGVWLERGRLDARDRRLLDSPLGLAGHPVMATLWWASGTPLPPAQREALLDAARATMAEHPALAAQAGATSPDARLVVCRALADRVEPVFALWRDIRARWRPLGWGLAGESPRIWRT